MSAKILIIDDEAHVRQMMRLTLEVAGYSVAEAEDGSRGLGAFGDGTGWDAVLLDQRMPGLDGLETLRRLEERSPGARVIMVTAFASIDLAVEAMKLGATDFLRKPMTPEMLRNAVAAALARPRAGSVPSVRSSEPKLPSVATMTLNGFRYYRGPDLDEQVSEQPAERRFAVYGPNGDEREVVVAISPAAVDQIARMTHRRIPLEDSYWTSRAERRLAEVLWKDGQIPSDRVVVGEASRDELNVAARWGKGE